MKTSRLRSRFITPEGGLAIKLKNGNASTSVKGDLVHITGVETVDLTQQGVPDCIGVWYESGVAQGQYGWVVVSGIASVNFIGNTTAGHLARTFVAADAGFVAGKALSEAVPTAPFASDKHFCEIGHVMTSRTGAGLAKVVLHFN